MKVNGALRGFCGEVGSNVVDAERHDFLPRKFD
jgi:hypothetical protein